MALGGRAPELPDSPKDWVRSLNQSQGRAGRSAGGSGADAAAAILTPAKQNDILHIAGWKTLSLVSLIFLFSVAGLQASQSRSSERHGGGGPTAR